MFVHLPGSLMGLSWLRDSVQKLDYVQLSAHLFLHLWKDALFWLLHIRSKKQCHVCLKFSLLTKKFEKYADVKKKFIKRTCFFKKWEVISNWTDLYFYIMVISVSSRGSVMSLLPLRRTSAPSWQQWTPTSRFLACTTARLWSCTAATTWVKSRRTSLPSPTSATAHCGRGCRTSVCSSGV